MTIASECIVAGELGLAYAAVCVVDNLANGVGDQPLTVEEFEAGQAREPGRAGRRARARSSAELAHRAPALTARVGGAALDGETRRAARRRRRRSTRARPRRRRANPATK